MYCLVSRLKIHFICELKKSITFVSEQISNMKVEFEKEYLGELYATGKTTDKKYRFQPQVVNGYLKSIKALQKTKQTEDLFLVKSLNYEKLKGNKKGFSSIRINDQYRLEFREIVNQNNIFKVEVCSLIDIMRIIINKTVWII